MPNASTNTRLRRLPAIATLVAEGDGGTAHPWVEGPRFPDAQQLLASGFAPDAVLLIPAEARQAAAWLESLRRDARLGLAPLLLARSWGESVDALSDGIASAAETLSGCVAAVATRLSGIAKREGADGDERLLTFLYLRPDYTLKPVADWRHERVYRYPLAAVLQQSQRSTHHAKLCQPRPAPRQRRSHAQPFLVALRTVRPRRQRHRIHQHQSGYALRMPLRKSQRQ